MKALLWNSVWRPGWRGGAAPSWVRRWQMDWRESTDGTETETESEERWENKTLNGKFTLKSEIQILNLICCEMEAALCVTSALTSRSYLAHSKETGRRSVYTAPPAGPGIGPCMFGCLPGITTGECKRLSHLDTLSVCRLPSFLRSVCDVLPWRMLSPHETVLGGQAKF